jgi:hypothetical protein
MKQDYGPKGCCGPAAFAALLLVAGGIASLVGWLA